jgi:hypothetical protein
MDDQQAPPFYPLTPDDRAALVVVAALIFLIHGVLGVIIKLFIRLNVTSMKDFDIVLLVGAFAYVAQTACVIVACNHGLGRHQDTVSFSDFEVYSKVCAPFVFNIMSC